MTSLVEEINQRGNFLSDKYKEIEIPAYLHINLYNFALTIAP